MGYGLKEIIVDLVKRAFLSFIILFLIFVVGFGIIGDRISLMKDFFLVLLVFYLLIGIPITLLYKSKLIYKFRNARRPVNENKMLNRDKKVLERELKINKKQEIRQNILDNPELLRIDDAKWKIRSRKLIVGSIIIIFGLFFFITEKIGSDNNKVIMTISVAYILFGAFIMLKRVTDEDIAKIDANKRKNDRRKAHLAEEKELVRGSHLPSTNTVQCPRCGNTNIVMQNKKVSVGRGVVGGFLLGPIGMGVGALTSKKFKRACLNCKKVF